MTTLIQAHQELFRRGPDECFDNLEALVDHCRRQWENSADCWERPENLVLTHDLTLGIEDNPDYRLNDWSFGQLCRLAGVSKETINRLTHETASRALRETLPQSDKPLQLLTTDDTIRSVHGVAYTRLWNNKLLNVIREFATDFSPPQTAFDGVSTGLYCGEQDLFCFLIDPAGWTEINGQAFAPGFFVWNSEVGRRSLGIQTFWFQAVCRNHIVWDAVDVTGFSRTLRDGKERIDVRYYILSVFVDAVRFANAARGHWGIENRLHWQLDVTFQEDQCRIRKGHADTNFSSLRRTALSLLKNERTAKVGVKYKRLTAGWDEAYLEKVLLGS